MDTKTKAVPLKGICAVGGVSSLLSDVFCVDYETYVLGRVHFRCLLLQADDGRPTVTVIIPSPGALHAGSGVGLSVPGRAFVR